ncbi:site-specific integrase [soil metagenome]
MREETTNTSFFLDASRPNAESKCMIKLNVYCKPDKKRYATGIHLTSDEWIKLNSPKLKNNDLKEVRQKLNAIEAKAKKVIKGLDVFSFVSFEDGFFSTISKTAPSKNLKTWFDNYIAKLKANTQIGTASSYTSTISALEEFRKNLSIHDVTPSFLENFERHLIAKGNSVSTVGIYLRQLRAIINQAIAACAFSADKYPFAKYQIPAGRNIKKALSQSELSLLLNYKTDNQDLRKALDFWIFSYLCNGMNFADIVEIKKENLQAVNYFHFVRVKTKRTKKKDIRPIKVGLNPRAIEIMNSYRSTDENPYLFPILEDGLNPVTIRNRCHRFVKWVNQRMEIIQKELGITQKIGTYAARHTFSTILKRKGVSTEFIKESLGHSSIVTTENYLDSFTDDVKLEYAQLLTQV